MRRHLSPGFILTDEELHKYNAKHARGNRKYRQRHREAIGVYQRAYRKTHPEKSHEKNSKCRAAKRNAPINDLTAKQWRFIKEQYGYRCVYCRQKMQHLTQDHLTPLSKGGSHTVTNVVPACHSCNSRKGNRTPLCPVQPVLLTP